MSYSTPKQIDFIHSLLDQVDPQARATAMAAMESRYTSEFAIRNDRRDLFGDRLPRDLASKWIDRLKELATAERRYQQESQAAEAMDPQVNGEQADRGFLTVAEYPEIPAGRYAVTGEDGTTDFYRIDHGKKKWEGTLFVKLHVAGREDQNLRGANARTIADKIMKAGPRAAAIRYGKELGACSICNRELTNNDSIEAGIGPVCAQKAGW